MRHLFLAAMVATTWLAGAVPALAAEGIPGATVRADSTEDEAARQARREQWCQANPEKCKEMQARRERCQADPEKCRAERHARREQWCKDNAERCSQMKARMEERRKLCEANAADCRPARRPGREA